MSIQDYVQGRRRRNGSPGIEKIDPPVPQFLHAGDPQTMEDAVKEVGRLAVQTRQAADKPQAPQIADLADPPEAAKRVATLIAQQMQTHSDDLNATADAVKVAFNELAAEHMRVCEESKRAVQLAADQAKILIEHCANSRDDIRHAAKRTMERHLHYMHGVRNTMAAVVTARDNLNQGGPFLDDDQLAAQQLAQSISNLERIAPNATILRKLRMLIDDEMGTDEVAKADKSQTPDDVVEQVKQEIPGATK